MRVYGLSLAKARPVFAAGKTVLFGFHRALSQEPWQGILDLSTSDQTPQPPAPAASGVSGPAVVSGWHDQDGILRDMWVRNQTPQAIAEALGRSVPAVMTRAARLGLPRRSAPGRKPGPRIDAGKSEASGEARTAPRAKPQAPAGEPAPQTSLRVCLMCLKKFESAGRHNRICSTCKSSAEYGTASALPEIPLPVSGG